MSLVTIKQSHYETDLIILKNKLESEGIKCFLRNEFTNQILSHMATFTVELQINQVDIDRAQEIIKQLEKEKNQPKQTQLNNVKQKSE